MTALEWLINHFVEYGYNFGLHKSEIKQAKEIEKQQIIDAYLKGYNRAYNNEPFDAEQYYNETYKNENYDKSR